VTGTSANLNQQGRSKTQKRKGNAAFRELVIAVRYLAGTIVVGEKSCLDVFFFGSLTLTLLLAKPKIEAKQTLHQVRD